MDSKTKKGFGIRERVSYRWGDMADSVTGVPATVLPLGGAAKWDPNLTLFTMINSRGGSAFLKSEKRFSLHILSMTA